MLISIVSQLRPLMSEAGAYSVRIARESAAEFGRGEAVVEVQLSHMDQYVTCHTEADETVARPAAASLSFNEFVETLERWAATYPDYGFYWVSGLRDLGDPEGHSVRGVSPILGWVVRPEHGEVLLVREDFPEVEQ